MFVVPVLCCACGVMLLLCCVFVFVVVCLCVVGVLCCLLFVFVVVYVFFSVGMQCCVVVFVCVCRVACLFMGHGLVLVCARSCCFSCLRSVCDCDLCLIGSLLFVMCWCVVCVCLCLCCLTVCLFASVLGVFALRRGCARVVDCLVCVVFVVCCWFAVAWLCLCFVSFVVVGVLCCVCCAMCVGVRCRGCVCYLGWLLFVLCCVFDVAACL